MHDVACELACAVGCAETIITNVLNMCVKEMFEAQKALNGCSATLVPKCLEMPVIFKPSLDWLDGIG